MSQQLFVPALGTIIVLAEDWTFKLFFERRNKTLLKALCPKKGGGAYVGYNPDDHAGSELLRHLDPLTDKELLDAHHTYRTTNSNRQPYLEVTLPAGSQLKIDRIYIRAGVTAYNSITFRTTKICPDKNLRSKRFWVKLQDANTIICDVVA